MPLAVSRLATVSNIPRINLETKRLMDKVFLPSRPIFEKISNIYSVPLLRQEPSSVEKFVEENAPAFLEDFAAFVVNTVTAIGPKGFTNLTKFFSKFDIKSVVTASGFSTEVTNNFGEAFALEVDNASYMLSKYGEALFSPDFMTVLVANEIEMPRLLTTSAHLYLSMFALVDGFIEGNTTIEPTMRELSRLCLRYAEEKDAQIMTVDLIVDKEKSESLAEAYEEYKRRAVNATV